MSKRSKNLQLYCYKGHYIWKNWNGDNLFTVEKSDQKFATLEAAQACIDEKYFKN